MGKDQSPSFFIQQEQKEKHMNKMIFCGDIHLKLWPDKEYDESGLPKKLIEILNCIEQMAEYANKNNIHSICIAGDINDTKGVVAVRPFVMLRQLIERYNEIEWIIIHGNHDATTGDNKQKHSAIQLLDGIPNVKLILEPETIEFSDKKLLLVPHSKNIIEVLQSELETYELDTVPEILVSHFGIDEAQLSTGISIKTSIRAQDLRMFKLVILGHYHKPQEIEYNETKIYYTGSPVPVRRDEATEEKRFLVVDIDTLDVQSIPTDGYRRYCELILDEETDVDEFKRLIEYYKSMGHHVVVRKKISELPLDLKPLVEENTQLIDMYEKDINIRGITSQMSDEEQARKYIEIMGVPENEQEEYLSVAMEIITSEGP